MYDASNESQDVQATQDMPVRVLLVDDHAVVRQGIKMFLGLDKEILVIGEAQNGQEACDLCAALKPDIVLMDIIMPVMDGLTATQRRGRQGIQGDSRRCDGLSNEGHQS